MIISGELQRCRPVQMIKIEASRLTQTARDLPVFTHWSVDALCDELVSEYPAFFINVPTIHVRIETGKKHEKSYPDLTHCFQEIIVFRRFRRSCRVVSVMV